MNRTLLDECFRVSGRTTWYIEPAEIQRDLDKSSARDGPVSGNYGTCTQESVKAVGAPP